MKKWLRLSLCLSLAGATAYAQDYEDDDYVPTQGARSLREAAQSSRSVVLGSGTRAGVIPDIYTVRPGDTLWGITGRYYGNPYEWPRIWSYNPEVTNPHWIYPLDRLRLRAEGTGAQQLETSVRAPRRAQSGTIWLRQQGYLDREAVEDSGVIIGSPEEHMLLSVYDEVYVRFSEGAQVQRGRVYTIYRRIDEEEREPEESGELVRLFGTVRLRSYDQERNLGRATILEALDPIERGFHIAPIPRRFDMVPPRENDRDIEAEVVASLRPLRIHADSQVVFINVGEEQGVQLGNRFFIVRRGDEWRDSLHSDGLMYGQTIEGAPEAEDDAYPTEVIAEGRVVSVRPGTSTLFVTRSIHEIEVGDRAEARRGF